MVSPTEVAVHDIEHERDLYRAKATFYGAFALECLNADRFEDWQRMNRKALAAHRWAGLMQDLVNSYAA